MTAAADVYALGTVLLYAAARHYPYDGAGWEAIAVQVANPDIGPDLSGVPEELKPLIAATLAHLPEDRPTLEAVADACADMLNVAGLAPADARLALISRTTGGSTRDPAAQPLSASFERVLEDQARVEAGGPDSPLDGLSTSPASETSDAEEEQPSVPLPQPAGPDLLEQAEPKPRRSSGRPPASKRVADELRADYAVNAKL